MRHRRWIGAALVLLLAGAGVVLLLRGSGDDGSLERVQATGELRVGLDASFPPFESLDADGQVIGYDADLGEAIAAGLGARPVFVNIGFDGLYDALLARRVDILISGLPYDPRRTQDVHYSEPYFSAGQVLVLRADEAVITGSAALTGHIVAVEWGSLADMEARRWSQSTEGMRTLPQPTAREALQALAAGQADAAIVDAVSAHQFMGEQPGVVRIAETLTDEPFVVATRLQSPRLAAAVDEALEELRQSGLLDSLRSRWF